MKKVSTESRIALAPTGGRSPEGGASASPNNQGAPKEDVKRWSARRKREVVLRMLHGEPMDKLSRELGIELYRLDEWRQKALLGMEESLRERLGDPLNAELDQAKKKIGELSMENELLRMRCEKNGPFPGRRLR